MSEFTAAVRAYLDAFCVGEERVLNAYTYLETIGKQSAQVHTRELLRREGPHVFVRVSAHRKGDDPTEVGTEIARWSEQQFVDAVLSDAHLRARLQLPAPEDREVIDRVLERLRAGERFRSSGADDGGGHSGRGTSGGSHELRAEGDGFVLEMESFYQPPGGLPEQTSYAKSAMDEARLRAELTSNGALRSLVGLPYR